MRILRILSAAVLALIIGLVPTLASTASAAGDEAEAVELVSVGDSELLDALELAGVLDSWYSLSPVSASASLLRVSGSAEYDARRAALLDDTAALAASRSGEIEVLASIARLEDEIANLDALARSLRARMMSDGRTLSPKEATSFEKDILEARSDVESDDLVQLREVYEVFRASLSDELLIANAQGADKNPDVAGLSDLLLGLHAMADDLDLVRDRAMQITASERQIVARIEAAIPELHRLRMHGTTDIDGLPVVTVDAYLQAGDHGIAGCGVEWTLLAGVGRIESIHGTLGGASVAANGAVSPRILGPLLDGGATEREAAEAALAAEVELANQARLEAEEEARIAHEEEERIRDLFGSLYVEPAPEPDAKPGEDDPDAGVLDQDASDEADSPGDSADSEGGEPEGNGFAVIADTDNGTLDGNSDWDRAVGPMQFIPSTWKIYAVDGNDDGVIDAHNLYDASASAAAYLCHLERRSGPSPWDYVLGYNASDSYVTAVMKTANRLESITLPQP